MHSWFECKVSFEKIQENGMQKKVTEPYLIDALSYTEAEARIIEEIRPFISGEFTITDLKLKGFPSYFSMKTEIVSMKSKFISSHLMKEAVWKRKQLLK